MLDSDLGWTGFRPYDSETWAWVSAALRPRFLLSSGSMSEASLVRVAGQLSFNTTFKGILYLKKKKNVFPLKVLGY